MAGHSRLKDGVASARLCPAIHVLLEPVRKKVVDARHKAGHDEEKQEHQHMTTKLFDLKGKVAIVTGGNGGIGLGLARGLADAGADIAVVGRNEAKSAAAVDDLRKRGVRAIAVATDVTDKAAVTAMIERVGKELGRIDILVNNAGTSIRKPAHQLELEEWHSVMNTNLTSA